MTFDLNTKTDPLNYLCDFNCLQTPVKDEKEKTGAGHSCNDVKDDDAVDYTNDTNDINSNNGG